MTYFPIGESLFIEKVIDQLEKDGLTINWHYGYWLANCYEVMRAHASGFSIVWIVEDQMQQAKQYLAKFTQLADRVVCWDTAKPNTLKMLEFHRI